MSTISNDELSIKVTVDLNEAEKKLQSVEATLDSTAKASEDAGKSFSIFGKSATELNQGLELVTKASKLAFEAIGFLTTSAIELIDRGERVGSLADGFERLGGTSDTINKAAEASKGLIANSDLLAIANKALVAGLPNVNENFELIAGAGAKLANTLGIDATQATEQLTQAIASGRDMQLRQLGVQVESEIAYKKYAESIGKATNALTENEKKLAIQTEAIEQLKKVNTELADVTDSASNAKTRLQNTIQNLVDDIAISINSNEDLAMAFGDIEKAIKEIDVDVLISGLTNLVNATVAFGKTTADVLGTVIFGYQQLKQLIDEISFNKPTEQIQKFNNSVGDISKGLKDVGQGIREVSSIEDLKKLEQDFWKLTQAVNSTDKGAELYGETLRKLQLQIKEIDKSSLTQVASFEKVETATGQVVKANKELETQHKKQQEDLKKLEEAFFKATNDGLTPFEKALKELIAANPEKDIEELRAEITELAQEALQAGEAINTISRAIEKIPDKKVSAGGNIFDNIFDGFKIPDSSIGQGIGEKIGADIASSITGSLSGLLDGILKGGSLRDDLAGVLSAGISSSIDVILPGAGSILKPLTDKITEDISNIGKSTASSIKGLGAILAPGFSQVFDAVFSFDKIFGGKNNPQANARAGIEKFFDEAIKTAKEKGVLLNKFLQDDFSLIAGRDAFDPIIDEAGNATTAVTEEFKKLPPELQAIFLELGTAFAQFFGDQELIAGQVGELLGANFDNLNDLQMLLQANGITLEQFEEALESAYLKGDISAKEYLSSLEATRDLMEQGIPGAVGAIDQAMDNLIRGGLTSGAKALDSLGDIAVEAAELGIENFDDLRERLIELGYSVEDVDKFFQALAANNITSLEDLKNVTAEQAAGIVSFLEDVGFGFQTIEEDIKSLKEELDKIKSKEIDIKVNFQTNYNNLNQDERNLINGNTGEGTP